LTSRAHSLGARYSNTLTARGVARTKKKKKKKKEFSKVLFSFLS